MSCDGPDCEKALQNLYLFIDNEIDDASCDEIEHHIAECNDCLSEFDLERVVKQLVQRSCEERAPQPLRERVLMSIRTVQVEYGHEIEVTSVERQIRYTD